MFVLFLFSKQVAIWQRSVGRHVSIENLPTCLSWKLDVVFDVSSSSQSKCVGMNLRMWGARDPGIMLAYK